MIIAKSLQHLQSIILFYRIYSTIYCHVSKVISAMELIKDEAPIPKEVVNTSESLFRLSIWYEQYLRVLSYVTFFLQYAILAALSWQLLFHHTSHSTEMLNWQYYCWFRSNSMLPKHISALLGNKTQIMEINMEGNAFSLLSMGRFVFYVEMFRWRCYCNSFFLRS